MSNLSTIAGNVNSLLAKLEGVRKTQGGHVAKCPAHDDSNPSLSVTEADGKILLNCHAGCEPEAVCSSLGIKMGDLFSDKPRSGNSRNGTESTYRKIEATYDYRNAEGNLLFQAVRYNPKGFMQRQPDPKQPGKWITNIQGVERVLFRLPEVINAIQRGKPIFLCEGEKDVLAMVGKGFSATTNAGGAGKWQDNYTETLRGADVVIVADKDEPGRKHAQLVAGKLSGVSKSVRVIELPDTNGKPVKDAYDFFAVGGDVATVFELAESTAVWTPQVFESNTCDTVTASLSDRLTARRFNIHAKPPEPVPRYFIGKTPICTPGNLTAISAGVKSGKSSFVGAMIAATMTTNIENDCLGVVASNPDGRALIHLDTEQSVGDHYALVDLTLRRAGLTEPPPWFESYCVTGFTIPELKECLEILLKRAKTEHGGVHSIFLDGAADFVGDVNDPAECNSFVAELHAFAIANDCPIIGLIHFNPGTEKTRGHLGSQLERKAETNLRLDKDGEAIVVWSEKNRRAPITKDKGPRFKWSDEHHMHVSCESLGNERISEKVERYTNELADVFSGRPAMRYGELKSTLETTLRLKEKTAEKRIKEWVSLNLISKGAANLYTVCT